MSFSFIYGDGNLRLRLLIVSWRLKLFQNIFIIRYWFYINFSFCLEKWILLSHFSLNFTFLLLVFFKQITELLNELNVSLLKKWWKLFWFRNYFKFIELCYNIEYIFSEGSQDFNVLNTVQVKILQFCHSPLFLNFSLFQCFLKDFYFFILLHDLHVILDQENFEVSFFFHENLSYFIQVHVIWDKTLLVDLRYIMKFLFFVF